jgi:hypothetical protein
VPPQQEPKTYFRATSAPCSARRGGPAPRFCHKARSMRFVTPKPESRVHWPGHGQEPCPVQTTRLAITRAGNRRNGLRTFYSPHRNDATPPSRPVLQKATGRAGGSAPTIPSRSSSWSTTGRAMDLRSIRVTLFSQHGPYAVRVPSVRSFHRRDAPPGVRGTSSVPLRHSRTLRPLRRRYSECRVQWPVHGNSREP